MNTADFTQDKFLHWCSSIIVEDVVLGNELVDHHTSRAETVDLNNIARLTDDETDHLLNNYTQLVMNVVADNWPNCFPEMKRKLTEKFETI